MKKKNIFWIYPSIIIGSLLIIINSCSKGKKEQTPVLTTFSVTDITSTTATCGGNIISDGGLIIREGEIGGGANLSDNGGFPVTARGVCWSTEKMPTIDDSKTNDGKDLGTFTSAVTGLSSNTTYYVRAYATNIAGTGYGNEVSFKSLR